MVRQIQSPVEFLGVDTSGVISFGAGQPDLPPPREVEQALAAADHGYGPVQGEQYLRRMLGNLHGYDPENIIITNGASEALFLAVSVCTQPGDKVLLTRPYYYSYPHMLRYRGAQSIYTDMLDGEIDLADFREKCREAKATIINSPANPGGTVIPPATIDEIERICQEEGTILIFDEVYERLVYEKEHRTPRTAININSFSKTFSLCGHRVGYAYSSDADLIRKMADHKTHSSMNTSRLSQRVAAMALNAADDFHDSRLSIWKERRDLLYDGIRSLGLSAWCPEGAFYIFPELEGAEQAVDELFGNHDLITYKGEWFGMPGRIRMSYATGTEQIREGLERLKGYLYQKQKGSYSCTLRARA